MTNPKLQPHGAPWDFDSTLVRMWGPLISSKCYQDETNDILSYARGLLGAVKVPMEKQENGEHSGATAKCLRVEGHGRIAANIAPSPDFFMKFVRETMPRMNSFWK
jgi:hypothetical protein